MLLDLFQTLDLCVPAALWTDFISAPLITGSDGGDRISDLDNKPEDLSSSQRENSGEKIFPSLLKCSNVFYYKVQSRLQAFSW